MVGDAEDQKRWKRYHEYCNLALRCEQEATGKREPWPSRAAKLEQARKWRGLAYHEIA